MLFGSKLFALVLDILSVVVQNLWVWTYLERYDHHYSAVCTTLSVMDNILGRVFSYSSFLT